MYFLALSDLADLLYKIFDNWNEESTYLQIPQVFHFTFEQLGEKLTADISDSHTLHILSDAMIQDENSLTDNDI